MIRSRFKRMFAGLIAIIMLMCVFASVSAADPVYDPEKQVKIYVQVGDEQKTVSSNSAKDFANRYNVFNDGNLYALKDLDGVSINVFLGDFVSRIPLEWCIYGATVSDAGECKLDKSIYTTNTFDVNTFKHVGESNALLLIPKYDFVSYVYNSTPKKLYTDIHYNLHRTINLSGVEPTYQWYKYNSMASDYFTVDGSPDSGTTAAGDGWAYIDSKVNGVYKSKYVEYIYTGNNPILIPAVMDFSGNPMTATDSLDNLSANNFYYELKIEGECYEFCIYTLVPFYYTVMGTNVYTTMAEAMANYSYKTEAVAGATEKIYIPSEPGVYYCKLIYSDGSNTLSVNSEPSHAYFKSYTVSFSANGGSGYMRSMTVGNQYPLPENTFTAPSGATFKCWEVNGTEMNPGDYITVSSNVTVKAIWKVIPTSYDIAFDSNGGAGTMASQTVADGTTTILSENTFTKEDYKFVGWNTSADGTGTSYENKASISSNLVELGETITLYAQWEYVGSYTVVYDANGGTGTMANQKISVGVKSELSPNVFTRSGYAFMGWNTSADGTGTEYVNKATVENLVAANNSITLYAIWEQSYTVSFNTNGHGTAPETINITKDGGKVTAPADPTADGYIFEGWYKEATCKNKWDFDNDTVTENITLYAKWIEYYHILSNDLGHVQKVMNGVAEVTEVIEVVENEEIKTIVIKLTSDINGKIWFGIDDSDYGSTAMNGNFIIDLGGKTVDPGTNKEEAICFDNNFAGKAIITGEGVLKRGINNIIYCKNSYKVWFDVADGMDYFTLKLGDEDLYSGTTNHTEAKSFYRSDTYGGDVLTLAQGTFTRYTVTFNANGGAVTPVNAITETSGKLSALPTPTKSGRYTFNGWYTAASGGTKVTTETIFSEDTTIYAQWTYTGGGGGGARVSIYTIKFNTNGGSAVANQNITNNVKLPEPIAPVKKGYVFDGWYIDKEFTTAYDFNEKVTKSFTLHAKWVEEGVKHVCPSEKFNDLDTTKWYHEDIDFVIENNIMLGTSETVFSPEGNLTRGMLVTILYRSEGEPATNRRIPFADVDMGTYYANAVSWAQQNGIVKGMSETEFAPDMDVTREQLAAIMYRYAQFKGMNAVTTEENLNFKDGTSVSEWAVSAMNWSVGKNYIFSRTEGYIIPNVAATRAEIAAFIHRYIVDAKK